MVLYINIISVTAAAVAIAVYFAVSVYGHLKNNEQTYKNPTSWRKEIEQFCSICLKPGPCKKILNCQHVFHSECIEDIVSGLNNQKECPYCQKKITCLIDI